MEHPSFLTLRDLDVRGRRVLVREDLNVPMKDGVVTDFTRIDAALETLRYLHEQGARTAIVAHLGRPDGTVNAKYSLRPVADELAKRLGFPVTFAEDCVGDAARAAIDALGEGGMLLLENVRFHAGEEANDAAFAQALAANADLYVNDAFGTAHRAHASTEGVAHLLPSAAGFLMQAELEWLARLMNNPARPYVCAIGGAKVVDKVGVFTNLIERVDAFVVGGGMANTFLAAVGIDVGTSLRDPDLGPATEILHKAKAKGVEIALPVDGVVATAFDDDASATTVPIVEVGQRMILDIGPQTSANYMDILRNAKTIVFNGPMGVFEKSPYRAGTEAVGEAMAQATANGATTVVGGGDAAAAAQQLGFAKRVSHVSTGGGATLEYLEGKTLPGVAALEDAARRQNVQGAVL